MKRYFMSKYGKEIKPVDVSDEDSLMAALESVDEGFSIEVTRQVEKQEKYNALDASVKENCNYCGECDKCVELIYMGDDLGFDNQVIQSTLLSSSYRPV